MKKILKYSVILIFIFALGCKEEFVELNPIAKSSADTYYVTMISADKAVTACYSLFCMQKLWDLDIMMGLGSIASDEAECAAGGKADVVSYNHIDQLRHTASEAEVFDYSWGFLYKTIGYCNVALEKLPQINKSTDATFDAALMQKRLAEVHYLRAFNYFTLNQIFGGVPVYDKTLGIEEYNKERDLISTSYKLIKADLWFAINNLPEKSEWGTANVGRASKGAAKALLAKVYLYESSYAKNYPSDDRFKGLNQHWDSAVYYAKQVIESPEYKLVGIDGERFKTWRSDTTGGYQWIFMKDANNSKEGVFEIQSTQDGLAWWDSRGTALIRWCAPRKINNKGVTNPTTSNGTDYGWGWWAPSKRLLDAYEAGDPRYKATVMTDQDSILCFVKDDGGLAWRHPNFNILKAGTGLSALSRKYECSYDEYWKNTKTWQDGPIHVKLIRLADVVLWAAEAELELNNQAEAVKYINMVRKRAQMSGRTNVPAPLSAVTHADIERERLVELGCEGHRYWDVIRWHLGEKYLNHTLADGDQIEFIPGKHEFFPIPSKQIDLSGGKLKQYSNW